MPTFNGGGCCGCAMQRKIDDVGYTRALLDDLATLANVDANRVFATGLSNGGQPEPRIVALPDKADDGMKAARTTWSGGKDGRKVVLIAIENRGHTWPGMEPPVAMLGKSTKDISANDLMWEFFPKTSAEVSVPTRTHAVLGWRHRANSHASDFSM